MPRTPTTASRRSKPATARKKKPAPKKRATPGTLCVQCRRQIAKVGPGRGVRTALEPLYILERLLGWPGIYCASCFKKARKADAALAKLPLKGPWRKVA